MINDNLIQKLNILSSAAKYDVSCASSGVDRRGSSAPGAIGNSVYSGICHSFTPDGRCVSLLKVLQSNDCVYDCKYCVNRRSSDTQRTSFSPYEIATITYEFYRRNYIEGLFLSSAVLISPDNTMEMMCETLRILRQEYKFFGYIHIKSIPGADPILVEQAGRLADRMSVNIELPTETSLKALAPQKKKDSILNGMKYISGRIEEDKGGILRLGSNMPDVANSYMPKSYGTSDVRARQFVPGGQSTQMIIGATPDTDYKIMGLAEALYSKLLLKRVYYSAYIPVVNNPGLPAVGTEPPLLREHRLYQADWLLRFYRFKASELLSENNPNLNLRYDPKCDWALRNYNMFPIEINRADYDTLLRIPGIGQKSASRIITSRKIGSLSFEDLKKLGVVLKRAQYFITCRGRIMDNVKLEPGFVEANLSLDKRAIPMFEKYEQLSLFDMQAKLLRTGDLEC